MGDSRSRQVAGGEHVLPLVVRVYEGPMAATELERLFSPVARSVPDAMPSGPLSREGQRAARGRLDAAKGDVPSSRLRDERVTELNGLDLPMGLSVEQLFTFAVELNVQPDGLPPAVLLMDLAATLAASADHRTALAAPPAAPRTADGYLTAGDPAAALSRYAGVLTTAPAEPHALAGWIVARANLGGGRTSRRMLARPELLQPLPSG
ncbi:hypothetical protein [Streptomyces tauricus]